jgi:hypothetical protein
VDVGTAGTGGGGTGVITLGADIICDSDDEGAGKIDCVVEDNPNSSVPTSTIPFDVVVLAKEGDGGLVVTKLEVGSAILSDSTSDRPGSVEDWIVDGVATPR